MASGRQTSASNDRAMTSSALAAATETYNRCWQFVGCRPVSFGRKLQSTEPWTGSLPSAAVVRGHVPEAVTNGQDDDDTHRTACRGLELDDDDWSAAVGKGARTRRRLSQDIKLDAIKFPASFRRVSVMSTVRRGILPKFPSAAATEFFATTGKVRRRHPSVTCCAGCAAAVATLRLLERRVDRLEAALNDVTCSGCCLGSDEQRQLASKDTDEVTDVDDRVTNVGSNSFAWSRAAPVSAADTTSSPTQSVFHSVGRKSTFGGRKTFNAVQPRLCFCGHVGAQSCVGTDEDECPNCIQDLDESPPVWQRKAACLSTQCDVTACYSRPLATAVERGSMTSSSTGFRAKCAGVHQQQTKNWKAADCCCVERHISSVGLTGQPFEEEDEPTPRSNCCGYRKSFRPSASSDPWDHLHSTSVNAAVLDLTGCCPCVLQQLRKKTPTECLHCRPCSNSESCDTLKCSTGTRSPSFRSTRQETPHIRGCCCCHSRDNDEEEHDVDDDENFSPADRGYVDVIGNPVDRQRCCQTYYRWRDSRNRHLVGNTQDSSPYAPFRPVGKNGGPNVQNDRFGLRGDVISGNSRHQQLLMGRGGGSVVARPGGAFLNYLRSTAAAVSTSRTLSSYQGIVGPLQSSTSDQRSEQVDCRNRAMLDRHFQCSTFNVEPKVVTAGVRARNPDTVVQSSPELDPHQIGSVVEDDEDVTGSAPAEAPCSCCNGRATLIDPALTRARLTSAADECCSPKNLRAEVATFVHSRPIAVATRFAKRPNEAVDEISAVPAGVGNNGTSKLPRHSLVAAVVQQAGAASGIKGQSKSLTLATGSTTSSADRSDESGRAADVEIARTNHRPNTDVTSENTSTVQTGCSSSIPKDSMVTSSAGRKITQALTPRDPSVFTQPILPVTDEQLQAFADALKILEEDIDIVPEPSDDDARQSFSRGSDERREAEGLRNVEYERNRRNAAATANNTALAVRYPFQPSPISSPAPTSHIKTTAVRPNVIITASTHIPSTNIMALLPTIQTNRTAVENERHQNRGPVAAVASGTVRHSGPSGGGNAVEHQNNVPTAATGNADVCVIGGLDSPDDSRVGCYGNRSPTVDDGCTSAVAAAQVAVQPSFASGPLNQNVAFTVPVDQQSWPSSQNTRASAHLTNAAAAAAAAAVDAPLRLRQRALTASISDKLPGVGSHDGAPVTASVKPQQLLTSAAAIADVSDQNRVSSA